VYNFGSGSSQLGMVSAPGHSFTGSYGVKSKKFQNGCEIQYYIWKIFDEKEKFALRCGYKAND
jgi:hypothetical protein